MTAHEAAQILEVMADSLRESDFGVPTMPFAPLAGKTPDLNEPERARETYEATVGALRNLAAAVAAENGGRGLRDAWDRLEQLDLKTMLILNTSRTTIELAGLNAKLA